AKSGRPDRSETVDGKRSKIRTCGKPREAFFVAASPVDPAGCADPQRALAVFEETHDGFQRGAVRFLHALPAPDREAIQPVERVRPDAAVAVRQKPCDGV